MDEQQKLREDLIFDAKGILHSMLHSPRHMDHGTPEYMASRAMSLAKAMKSEIDKLEAEEKV